jgi:hypothetical protein
MRKQMKQLQRDVDELKGSGNEKPRAEAA